MDVIVPMKENRDFRRVYARGRSYVSPSRRVIREAYRQAYPRLKKGYDVVFVARGRTPFVKSTEVYRAMMKHFRDAGVLQ